MCERWLFTEYMSVSKTMFSHCFVTVHAVTRVFFPPEFSVLPTEKKTVLVLMSDSSALIVCVKSNVQMSPSGKQTNKVARGGNGTEPTNQPTN